MEDQIQIWAEAFRHFIDTASHPSTVFAVAVAGFYFMLRYYRTWTKPKFAFSLFFLYLLFMGFSVFGIPGYVEGNPNFAERITRPDNVPIILLQVFLFFFLWLAFRQAAINDERIENGKPPIEKTEAETKIFTWPDLVYVEFLTVILLTVALIAWSILIPAPLEEPANPSHAPNPSKAPWYFLGLQELLVYFDPWIAGVVLPTLILVGLMAIPYMDKNPRGSGYYTFMQRPFAITVFLFGFLVLWMLYIQIGTFLRGPNWNFFGPYEHWNVAKSPALVNIHLSEKFWIDWLGREVLPDSIWVRELPGMVSLILYFFAIPPLLLSVSRFFRKLYQQMGFIRWSLMVFLLLTMMGIPIKQLLRWTWNIKYVLNLEFVNI